MDDEEKFLNMDETRKIANISVEMAKIAREELMDLVDGAETKAYYGLVRNYTAFTALIEALLERSSMSGQEVRDLLATNGATPFENPMIKGYRWTQDGALETPDYPPIKPEPSAANGTNGADASAFPIKTGYGGPSCSPYRVRIDLPDDLVPRSNMKLPSVMPKIPGAVPTTSQ
jgi:hypothetical protein